MLAYLNALPEVRPVMVSEFVCDISATASQFDVGAGVGFLAKAGDLSDQCKGGPLRKAKSKQSHLGS